MLFQKSFGGRICSVLYTSNAAANQTVSIHKAVMVFVLPKHGKNYEEDQKED